MKIYEFETRDEMCEFLENWFATTSQDKYSLGLRGEIYNNDSDEEIGNIYTDDEIQLFDCRLYKVK